MNEKTKIVMLPAECLEHHPENPRKEIGDISELTESIKLDGILQNLTVVPKPNDEGKYLVVIGNRRYEAGLGAGLKEFPCVISDMSHSKQLETMLVENMNRSDLTVYEQAKGFEQLTLAGYSVDDIAEKTGFSKSTVRRRINLCQYDERTVKEAFEKQATFEDFEKLNKIVDDRERNQLTKYLGSSNFNWYVENAIQQQRVKERERIVKEAIKDTVRALKDGEYLFQFERVSDCSIRLFKQEKECNDLMYEDIKRVQSLPAPPKGKEYTYMQDYNGNFDIYITKDKEPEAKTSAPKYQKEWEEYRRLISDMSDRHINFIKEYNKQPKSVPGFALLCLDSIAQLFTNEHTYSIGYTDMDDISDFMSEINQRVYFDDCDSLLKFYKSKTIPYYIALTSALLLSNAGKNYSYLYRYGKNGSIAYNDCNASEIEAIKIFAKFIKELGYKMSDEEEELINGTHRLYHLEDEGNEEAE